MKKSSNSKKMINKLKDRIKCGKKKIGNQMIGRNIIFLQIYFIECLLLGIIIFFFLNMERQLVQADHWQHCFRTSDETVGFTSIGSTLDGRITSPSGGSRICFCETIR